MHAASNYRGTRHIDLARAAEREARELDNRQAADSKLDIKVKVMLIGMTGGCRAGLGVGYMADRRVHKSGTRESAVGDGRVCVIVRQGVMHQGAGAKGTARNSRGVREGDREDCSVSAQAVAHAR